jgi:hypothetical protein
MTYKEFRLGKGFADVLADKPPASPDTRPERASGYDTMKKAELVEAAKRKGVHTENMDKPSTGRAAIIKALRAAGETAAAKE